MMIGIDIGTSLTKCVVLFEHLLVVIQFETHINTLDFQAFQSALIQAVSEVHSGPIHLGLTGARADMSVLPVCDKIRVKQVDEIQAIGRGGLSLSGLETRLCPTANIPLWVVTWLTPFSHQLVYQVYDLQPKGALTHDQEAMDVMIVNVGTGTAVVSADPHGRVQHVAGSGIGGGTLMGLAAALVDVSDWSQLHELACAGNRHDVDLCLKDVTSLPIGNLPPYATCSNLARLSLPHSPADIAGALFTMVYETVGTLGAATTKLKGQSAFWVTGTSSGWPLVRQILAEVGELYQVCVHIPLLGAYTTALGAAILSQEGWASDD